MALVVRVSADLTGKVRAGFLEESAVNPSQAMVQLISSFRSLEADEAWALEAMMNHLSFGEICAGLCHWLAEAHAAPRAAALLRGWVDEGWIAAVETT